MDELEEAFYKYLQKRLGGRESVEVRIRDLRDSLVPQFISPNYPLSKLSSDIAKLVRHYRHERRILTWLSAGLYSYHPSRQSGDQFFPLTKTGRAFVVNPAPFDGRPQDVPDAIRRNHFETVAQLANSSEFLVVRDLPSRDLELLENLSF